MLRYAFLPSDFHPQFLILGERDDLANLAELLERFAADGAPKDLPQNSVGGRACARLSIVAATGKAGIAELHDSCFQWALTRGQAAGFGALVRAVSDAKEPAGSVMLEMGGLHDIPVKVSQGEFTDSYLIDSF